MLHNFSLCLKQKLNDLLDFSGNFGKVLIAYELDCTEKCSKNGMALKFQHVPYLIKTHRLFYPHEIINISSNIFPLGRCRKTKAVEFPTYFTVFAGETRRTQTAILFVCKSGLAEGIVVAMILITSTLKGNAKQFSGQAMLWLSAVVQFVNAMIRSSTRPRWWNSSAPPDTKRVGQKMTLSLLRVPRTKYYNLNFFISSP